MSAALESPRVTVNEFVVRPERWDGCFEELIDGVVYVSPNVKPRHNNVVRRVERTLLPLEKQGFIVLGEVACKLSEDSLPNTDACVFRRERWEGTDEDSFIEEAPALAIEVVSPGNRNSKVLRKTALYLDHGAEQVWNVNPKTWSVRVVTPDDDYQARGDESIELHGLHVTVPDLFR